MRAITLPIALLLFFACKSRKPSPPVRTQDTATILTKDTVQGDTDEVGYPTKYVIAARLDLPDQTILLATRHAVVNGQVDLESHYDAASSYFICFDKRTGKSDTVDAQLDNNDFGVIPPIIRNMTDSFQLKPLVVQVVTQGEDIYFTNSFLGFKNGKFAVLFSIDLNTREDGIKLHREGNKLVGYTTGRDEIVSNLEEDYPVEIDLNTYEVQTITPEKQYIGWESKATQAFRAHRVINGRVDSSLVAVPAGTELTVDTLYRALGKVRLRLADSVIVEIKTETGKNKLQGNAAG